MEKRPNVLFIMTDQFNARCIGVKGSQVRTPNIDMIAKDGILLDRAYCNNPICGPSRVSFITGQYPHTHGIFANDIYELDSENDKTIAAVFRKMGYQTALVGKSHMIRKWDAEGFEYIKYCDLTDCDRNNPLENHYFRYLYERGLVEKYDLGSLREGHPGKNMRAFDSDIPGEHCVENWTGNTAVEFIRNRDERRPFFLLLSFQRPHDPLSVPHDVGLLYDPDEIELPKSAAELFEKKFASKPDIMRKILNRTGGYPYVPSDESDLKRQLAYYYSLITLIDEQIGKVIYELKSKNLYENTIIVFTADHGDFAGEHGLMFKNIGIYESIHRIPFIIKYPCCEKGKIVKEMVESVDLFPTLCSLCDIDIPSEVEGINILQVLENCKKGKEKVFCEWEFPYYYDKKICAVRTENYRMVYYGQSCEGELYDIANDPYEMQNLYSSPEYKDVRYSLLEIMFDFVNSYSVKAPKKMDNIIGQKNKYSLTRMIHKAKVDWGEISGILK